MTVTLPQTAIQGQHNWFVQSDRVARKKKQHQRVKIVMGCDAERCILTSLHVQEVARLALVVQGVSKSYLGNSRLDDEDVAVL